MPIDYDKLKSWPFGVLPLFNLPADLLQGPIGKFAQLPSAFRSQQKALWRQAGVQAAFGADQGFCPNQAAVFQGKDHLG